MKRLLILFCLPLLLGACVARNTDSGGDKPKVTKGSTQEPATLDSLLPEGHRPGQSVEINGAKIIAIIADNAETDTPYLVLHEAIEQEVCKIRETGAVNAEGEQIDGDVNTLLVTNTGSQPIFLMAGDLVLGGKQDRILSESVVVDPGVTDMEIPVFCVEHGRWTVQEKDGELASKGEFTNTAKAGQVDVSVKTRAIYLQSQSAVWDSVEQSNAALSVTTSSGTFRATFDDEETAKKIDDAYAKVKGLQSGKVVGYAVVHNGEVVAMDVFDSTALAAKVEEKLVRAYIITALGNGYELPLDRKLARRNVTWVCEDRDIRDAADQLGRELGLEIVVEEGVEGEVSLELDNADGLTALSRLAESVEARAWVEDNRIRLTGVQHMQQQQGEPAQFEGITYAGSTDYGTFTLGTARSIQFATPSEGADIPAVPEARMATPNERTENSREYEREAVKYSCKDKKTGKKVQTSYLRR